LKGDNEPKRLKSQMNVIKRVSIFFNNTPLANTQWEDQQYHT